MTSPVQAQTNFAPDLTVKPSPEEIDQLAANINNARASEAACAAVVADLEKRAIDLVAAFGAPVPKAEASRRLEGRLTQITVTTGNTITLVEDRIEDLRQALVANNRGELFSLLFRPRVKHELVEGADAVVRTESVNKRLGEKILQLFGRCFNARKKKPSVKVDVLGELKPRKRAKKENA